MTTTCSDEGFLRAMHVLGLPHGTAQNACYLCPMPNIGTTEILLLLLLALLLFGAKRLPEIGRSMGRGMREFKDSITGKDDDDKEKVAELPPPSATTVSTMSAPDDDDMAEARAEHEAAAERLKEAEEQLRSLEAKH